MTGTYLRLGEVEAVPRTPLILIVEEQPAIREMLCWMLQLAGYRTMVCASRDATLAWREQTLPEHDPALILLDVSLLAAAEAAGFLCRLRARWRDAADDLPQVIVLTTSPEMKTALGQRERVLLKPFHIRDLFGLIQQMLTSQLDRRRVH